MSTSRVLTAARSAAAARRTVLSACRRYRYTAWREWIGGDGYVLLLGLNPSTADERVDDATLTPVPWTPAGRP